MNKTYVCLDIGGTWIKGIAINVDDSTTREQIINMAETLPVDRVESKLTKDGELEPFLSSIHTLLDRIVPQDSQIASIAVSTAGVVDYAGTKLELAAPHLKALTSIEWLNSLQATFGAPVILVNDADAAAIGAATKGYMNGYKTVAVMPIGTGLGFTVCRNGRKWNPNFAYTLLGSIQTPAGSFDEIVSASALSKCDKNGDLQRIFTHPENQAIREEYIKNLAQVIYSADTLYHIDQVLLGGGLADATLEAGFAIDEALNLQLQSHPTLSGSPITVHTMKEGNRLPLVGVAMVAVGEAAANSRRRRREYKEFTTESPYDATIKLHTMPTDKIVKTLWNAEQEAGSVMEKSLDIITKTADVIAERLSRGGRLIYVGAGTSGRLATIDTVEIACTFGFPRDKVLTMVAGGVADASIEIEAKFEEDASAVPELLLANLTTNDVVVGISVSGSAYYAQSALGFAQSIGAASITIQEEDIASLPYCDYIIPLRTGYEVIAGSTRMKAGTATKKVINFLSTTAMIKLGKVTNCYMTELECINEKLIKRAQNLLNVLFNIDSEQAYHLLEKHNFSLNKVIEIEFSIK